MILVTGATGKVGSAAVQALTQRDAPVRALVRDEQQAAALIAAGAEPAVGDFTDPASLERAVAGVDTVILVSPAVPAQELAVVDAAARAGVGHVVKATSKASADSPVARRRGQAQIEAGIKASGLAHTFLRSNAYMQNFLALAPLIKAQHAFASSAGDGQVGLVDARDVGAVAAQIALDVERLGGQVYRLTGPELLTYGDAAAILSDVLGHEITFTARTEDEDRAALLGAGLPAQLAEDNARAFSLIGEGDAAWVSDDVATILGRPPRSFRDFATENAAAFA